MDSMGGQGLISLVKLAFDFPLGITFSHRGAFIVKFLTFRHSNFQLGSAVLQIDLQGDNRDPFLAHRVPQAS